VSSVTPAGATPALRGRLSDRLGGSLGVGAALLATAGLVGVERGSIAARDWLPYALGLLLVAGVLLLAGGAARPPRAALVGVAGLLGLAAWSAASIAWSPSRALARDEALLVLLYATALLLAPLSLRTAADRLHAVRLFVAAGAGIALVTALVLRLGGSPETRFFDGRLSFPVSYANALAAIFLLSLWPAIVLAARRRGSIVERSLATGAAALAVGAWLSTQSKGAGLGLAVSALVFFLFVPQRLRAVVPVLIAAGAAGVAAAALTEPYRTEGAAAARGVGTALLAVFAGAALAGAAYAAVDRRVRPSERAVAAARRAVAAVLVLGAVAGAAVALSAVGSPRQFVSEQWDTFKGNERVDAGTHLADVGSNRYDFWRVALDQFESHPVAGVGARGFGALYLQYRETDEETPRRSHSLVLDTLLELGLVGFALLAIGLGAPLLAAASRARRPSAAAALAGASLWLTGAAVDWIWTLPAAGLPFFLLLGIGASEDAPPLAARGPALAAGAAAVAAAALLVAPPWLAARIVARANDPGDLDVARVLDPVSAEPDLAAARLTPFPESLAAYGRAAEREPREWLVRYEYGVALLAADRRREARAELEAAQRLWPGNEAIRRALAQTR
jgi:O-antigen ligase